MLKAVQAILAALNGLIEFVSGLVTGLINAIGMISQASQMAVTLIAFLPAGLAVFAVVFIAIMIINRLSFGSNGD